MSDTGKGMDWITGASLGLLVGLLVGLSTSPVTATVVGALAALLGGVFGLAEKLPTGLSSAGARRLAAFALACVVALLCGVLMRTYQVLAPSAEHWRAQLKEIGISDEREQNQMLRFLRFGLLPQGVQAAGKDGETAARSFASNQGLLYAENTSFCAGLRDLIRTDAGADDLLSHLRLGGSSTRKVVQTIQDMPPADRLKALQAAPLYLCEP